MKLPFAVWQLPRSKCHTYFFPFFLVWRPKLDVAENFFLLDYSHRRIRSNEFSFYDIQKMYLEESWEQDKNGMWRDEEKNWSRHENLYRIKGCSKRHCCIIFLHENKQQPLLLFYRFSFSFPPSLSTYLQAHNNEDWEVHECKKGRLPLFFWKTHLELLRY